MPQNLPRPPVPLEAVERDIDPNEPTTASLQNRRSSTPRKHQAGLNSQLEMFFASNFRESDLNDSTAAPLPSRSVSLNSLLV